MGFLLVWQEIMKLGHNFSSYGPMLLRGVQQNGMFVQEFIMVMLPCKYGNNSHMK
jgi:hypothetical protein